MCVKNLSVLISFILLLSFTGGVACAQTPVGFWPFEEGGGGTTADLGSGGNDGTLTGDAAFVNDAQRGKCIELSGSGYINIPSGVIEFGDGFTIVAWIKTSNVGRPIVSKSDTDTVWEPQEKQFYVAATALEGQVHGGAEFVGWGCDFIVCDGTTVNNNTWRHVAVTWNGISTGRIYVDGNNHTGWVGYNGCYDNFGNTVRIGFRAADEHLYGHFIGRIDDVGIYDTALTEGEIEDVMDNGFGEDPNRVKILGSWTSGLTHIAEAGTNRALILTAHTQDDDSDMNITTVTYGGQLMTKIIDKNYGTGVRVYVAAFILDEAGIAAASGSTFVPTWAQSPSQTPGYSSVFLSDVDQTYPTGYASSNGAYGEATIATDPLWTTNGDMVIVGGINDNLSGEYAVLEGFTEALELSGPPDNADAVVGYKAATGIDVTPKIDHVNPGHQAIIGFVVQNDGASAPDTTPPTPNPATWASPPAAASLWSITMTANTGTDDNGVQYYFEEISGNGGHDSIWQDSPGYADNALKPNTLYTYRVKMRDQTPFKTEGNWSDPCSATTDAVDCQGQGPDGDLDDDCDVDIDDAVIFFAQWLDEPPCIGHPDDCADLDEENDNVDGEDFAVLSANWQKAPINLFINEMMADNETTIADEHGQYDDWIEIFNPGSASVSMSGMFLEDNNGNIWTIPAGISIGSGQYLLFWADDGWPDEGDYHTNFGLSSDGDGVTLYDTDGSTVLDSKTFTGMDDDISYGRYPDATDDWYDMSNPTPGLPNTIGMAGEVYFSRPAGTFTTNFSLGLTTKSPTATIYYTKNGDEPTDTVGPDKLLYSAPFTIDETTWVRARAYDSGPILPGPITSAAYLKLHTDVADFETNLPIVVIDTFTLNIDEANRNFHPVISAFIDTDQVTGNAVITDPADYAGYAGMHIRGQSSDQYGKKQYRFEVWDENDEDKNVALLGMPSDSDWIIHAPFSDRTLMRNYQMYTWSRQIGRYAVRCRFVELFLDMPSNNIVDSGDYWGVYVLMEKIKRDKNRLDIGALGPTDLSEPEITGGYVFEKGGDDSTFTTTTYDDGLVADDPEWGELEPEQQAWIENHFNDFEADLAGGNFDNPLHTDYYGNYIDIGSFVDHHILVELGKNVDGFLLSTFLYKERGGKINMGPIWDYNGALGGADYICNWLPQGWMYEAHDEVCCPSEICCVQDSCWRYRLSEGGCEDDELPNHYGWYERLFEDPEFLLAYADNWFDHREHDFKTANMLADIDNNVTLLTTNVGGTTPVGRNFSRWNILNEPIWPDYLDNIIDPCHPGCTHSYPLTYAGHVDWLRDWVDDRLTWMDLEIDTSYGDAPPDIKVNSVNKNRGDYITTSDSISMTAGGGTIYYTTDGTDPRLHGGATSGSASAYGSPFTLSCTTQIKARIRYASDNWSALNEATFSIGPVADNLRITEIMYHVNDPNHEYIELKNIGGTAFNLNLVKFTDGIDFTFPSMTLPAGGYVVAVRNQAKFTAKYPGVPGGKIAGEFIGALNNAGERIELQDALGQTILNFRFKDGWYPITDGADFSLDIIDPTNPDPNSWEYAEYWQPSSVSGGTPGADDTGHVASPGDIVINEVMTHTDIPPNDWIELHNTTGSTIDITGWFLSDDDDNFKRYQIGVSGSVTIPPNGYKVFTEDDHFGNGGDPGSDVPFALKELGETVYLCSGSAGELAGGFCANEDFGAAENGVSFGRYTKSAAAAYDVDFVSMTSPTYEVENTTGAKVGPIVITEIMYHPASNNYAEYVELKNISGGTVLLDDWKFNDEDEGIEYYIPSGTSLAAGQYLILTKNEVALNEEFSPAAVTILEWVEGRLSNAGEKIQISKPGTPEPGGFVPYIRVDRVNYSDGSHGENFRELGYNDPWPTSPDGTGQALHRLVDGDYGNDVANWQATSPTPGN